MLRKVLSENFRGMIFALACLAGVLALRGPSFGFAIWNVDEAIHAAVARTILDGGVLYRDAIDQRTPLSYYAFAAVFAVAGENNLVAVHVFVAVLIAMTAWMLFRAAGRERGGAGLAAAVIYGALATALFYQGDANAANTEWFVAFFTAAAMAVFFASRGHPGPRRLFIAGTLLGAAFLSKQPALLDCAAPVVVLAWMRWQRILTTREVTVRLLALAAGWLTPVLLTLGYLTMRGALADAVFYTWTYNLAYYGREVGSDERFVALLLPFRLLVGTGQGVLLALWLGGAGLVAFRLLQRTPTPGEHAAAPGGLYLAIWSLTALAGTAASGRNFGHYAIQFLPAFALGAGLAVAAAIRLARDPRAAQAGRLIAAVLVLAAAWSLGTATAKARSRTLPEDPSLRVSAYIREHTMPTDRIFVWGYHPDIYLHADRRPASRFVYCSFLTGLIPWTNVAPDRDTAYAIVPGAMDTLLRELAKHPPAFIVDCSAGPNRHWDKYPLEKFPPLRDFIREHYEVAEAGQFVPQGFRLFRPRKAGVTEAAEPELNPAVLAQLGISVLGPPLPPASGHAPHGAGFSMVEGRAEYFAHAPSRLIYRLPGGVHSIRGGFGIRPAAYAPGNPAPTDGAEFVVTWRGATGSDQVLLRRLLRPRDAEGDRGVQSFRVELPGGGPGELTMAIEPGPAGNPASDWTFWTDLTVETFR